MSKYLSYLLRHGAVKEGLEIDGDGNVTVNNLLDFLKNKRSDITTLEQLQAITTADKKKRFTLENKDGVWQMRANQGHSINTVTEAVLTPITDATKYPEIIHGTFRKLLPTIQYTGLSRMSRNHIHFADGHNAISGIRGNTNVFIYVNLQKALDDGIKFYVSDNGVILTPGNEAGIIEPKYFSKIEDSKGHNLFKRSQSKPGFIPPCAGCIVFQTIDNVNHVCLVKTHTNVYGFPKGKRNKGETSEVTALRELEEETNIKESDIEPLDEIKYVNESSIPSANRKGNVSTRLYVTKLTNNAVILTAQDVDEIAACSFVPIEEAMSLLMEKRQIVLTEALALL